MLSTLLWKYVKTTIVVHGSILLTVTGKLIYLFSFFIIIINATWVKKTNKKIKVAGVFDL